MRALLLVAGIALLVHAPPAVGAGRLDVLAAQLRERPLAIDSELAWFFTPAEQRRLVRTLRRSPVDFRVAVLPQVEEDESGGDGQRIVASLYQRLRRRPGIYLVVDEHGYLDVGIYSVPRDVFVPFEDKLPPTGHPGRPGGEVAERLERIAADVAAAPPGQTTDRPYPRPLEPYENWRLRRHGESTGDTALGAAVVGGILGVFAGGVARLRARRTAASAPRPARRRRRRRRR
ncbi:MAG TPA: hypothetical protein VD836_04065 [Solirubrobacteraceae bacterium]|nr:hypothetical protein [Solirubrobacteraceae bacterium]